MADHHALRPISGKRRPSAPGRGAGWAVRWPPARRRIGIRADQAAIPQRAERILEHRGCPASSPVAIAARHAGVDLVDRQLGIFGAKAAVNEHGVADFGHRRVAPSPSVRARPTGSRLAGARPSRAEFATATGRGLATGWHGDWRPARSVRAACAGAS